MDKALKILMLEDSLDDIYLIERELRQGGIAFTSFVVSQKDEFQKALRDISPDIILADHSLPGFNSIEALKIFEQYQSEAKIIIPFILITGSVSEEFAAQRIKAGVDDYILKDRLKRLPASIRSALEKRRIERERLKFLDEIISNEAMMREAEQLAHFGSWQVELIAQKYKWSDEIYRIFGYDAGDPRFTHETFLEHIHPEDRQYINDTIEETIRYRDSNSCEFRIIVDRVNVKYLFSKILVKHNQERQPFQLLGFILDITQQRKQTEALARQNKHLIDIAWIQSHEVRGPLARLIGLVNLVMSPPDESSTKDLMKSILASANELDNVIRRIVRKTEAIDHDIK